MQELVHQMEELVLQGKLSEADQVCKKLIEAGMSDAEASKLWVEAYKKFKSSKKKENW